jgi:putative copper resistance protein D
MRMLYLVSVYLHIVAAVTWLGSILFLVLVVVPWMRRNPASNRPVGVRLLAETGSRFRAIAWFCFATVLVTGTFNLYVRGVRLADLGHPEWHRSGFGSAVMWKLTVFVIVVLVSAAHDFWVGPRATRALLAHHRDAHRESGAEPLAEPRPSSRAQAERLRRVASYMGRFNALLALVLVALGVVLVRGWP